MGNKLMAILVTGVTGFIGSHLIKSLIENGYKDIVVLRRSKSQNCESQQLFIYNINSTHLEDIFLEHSIETIIHLASSTKVNNPMEIFNINIKLSTELLSLSMKYQSVFINVDSSSYYYRDNLYSKSKKLFRDMLISFNATNSINLVAELVYGENENKNRFIPMVIEGLTYNRSIDMTEGVQTRNIIHVDDFIGVMLLVLKRIETILPKYNEIFVASNDNISIRDLMFMLKKIIGSKSQINFGAKEYIDNDSLDTVFNNDVLNAMKWEQTILLEDGLSQVIKNMRG
jgi:nucleoside-diphosphate-sugar epimerase